MNKMAIVVLKSNGRKDDMLLKSISTP